MKPTIAITLGEPAGIGPEVVVAALRSSRVPRNVRYEVLGETAGVTPGRPTVRSARMALSALEEAVEGWKAGRYGAMVTGPVCKEGLVGTGKFDFPGQTEFFAKRCGLPLSRAVMMMSSPRLTVALLSTHCRLSGALRQVTSARLRYVLGVTAGFLLRTGIKKPRIAVAGLNPHAGENGLFGDEEGRILAPVVAEGCPGAVVSGPHSPDAVYRAAVEGGFDAVIAPYHDQGLIPFKLVSFEDGVNVTLGLPLIRTSPDHGTAFDLAGTGKADARSMIAAIRLAARLCGADAKK